MARHNGKQSGAYPWTGSVALSDEDWIDLEIMQEAMIEVHGEKPSGSGRPGARSTVIRLAIRKLYEEYRRTGKSVFDGEMK